MIPRSLSPAGAPSSATVRRCKETAYCWKNMNCTLRADGACSDWGFCDTVCRHFELVKVVIFSLFARFFFMLVVEQRMKWRMWSLTRQTLT